MKHLYILLFCAVLAVKAEDQPETRLAPSSEMARTGEFPHLVSIQIHGQHTCGGSLVSKRHVLTAAHCVADLVAQQNPFAVRSMTVEVGSNTIGGGRTHAIKRIAHKRGYENNPYGQTITPNDVAVITLKTPVTTSSNVAIISMAQSGPPAGTIVDIAGYGNEQIGGQTSRVLKKTKLRIVSNSECNSYYGRTMGKTIMSSQICAKLRPGYGTCQGDSGGPLMYNGQVFAVVSAGDGNCGAGNPDIFTLLGPHMSFIQGAMSSSPSGGEEVGGGDSGSGSDESGQWPPKVPGYPGEKPEYPGIPGWPPKEPEYPGMPGWPPKEPKYPEWPGKPERPTTPKYPDYPSYPEYPDDPSSETGDYPGKPERPQYPGERPQYPTQPPAGQWPPGIPGTPGFPSPGQPGYPTPGQPEWGQNGQQVIEWKPGQPYPQPPQIKLPTTPGTYPAFG